MRTYFFDYYFYKEVNYKRRFIMKKNLIKWISTTPQKKWEDIKPNFIGICEDILEITGEEFQKIDGFGGCFNELGWIAISRLDKEVRDQVLAELFDPNIGCCFNFCRLPIGASDYAAEWYSCDEHDGDYLMEKFSIERDKLHLIPYIKEALKYNSDIQLFASPWSPPTWMKFPKAYNYGTLIWDEKILDAYALYFQKFINAYDSEGIKIDQIHIQNEPGWDHKFPSCLWKGEEFREFIADYLGPLFEKNNVNTEIWLGTMNVPELDKDSQYKGYDHYTNLVLSDEKARKFIKGVSFQWEGKHAIQRTCLSWPEMKLMQSENECGDGNNTWEYAHYVFSLLWQYIANGVNSYIYWNMILEPKGRSTWGWNQNSLITVDPKTLNITYNPEFYVIKHFSHFIKKGALRLRTNGHWTGNSLAFKNPDGEIVVVTANALEKCRNITLLINGKSFSVELKPCSFNTFTFK